MISISVIRFKLLLAVISVLVNFVSPFDFTQYPDCTDATALPYPRVPAKFTIKAERKQLVTLDARAGLIRWPASELQLGRDTVESVFDLDEEQGATTYTFDDSPQSGPKTQYLWNVKRSDSFMFTDTGKCLSIPILEGPCLIPLYVLFDSLHPSGIDVSSRCNLTTTRLTYVGQDTIRDAIPVRKWKQCVHNNQLTVNSVSVNYYYTANDNVSGLLKDTPIRFESRIADRVNRSREHVEQYDITYFAEGIASTSVFLPSPGSFCLSWNRENKTIPSLPVQFSLSALIVSERTKEVHKMTSMDFNRVNEQVAFRSASSVRTRFPLTPGQRDPDNDDDYDSFMTLHDYKSGLAFNIPWTRPVNQAKKTCKIYPIDRYQTDQQAANATISMSIRREFIYELMDLNSRDWIYLGQREFNQVLCHVWSRQEQGFGKVIQQVTEVYWIKEEWAANNVSGLYGMMVYRKNLNGTIIDAYTIAITSLYVLPTFIRLAPFIGDDCAMDRTNAVKVEFLVKRAKKDSREDLSQLGPPRSLVYSTFIAAMMNGLSDLLRISSLRFIDIDLSDAGNITGSGALFQMTVLDLNNLTGVTQIRQQRLSRYVFAHLKRLTTATDFNVTISYDDDAGRLESDQISENVTIVKGSVQLRNTTGATSTRAATAKSTGTMATDSANLSANVKTDTQRGYSSGDMAGLAFSLLIISGSAGVAGGYFFNKIKLPNFR